MWLYVDERKMRTTAVDSRYDQKRRLCAFYVEHFSLQWRGGEPVWQLFPLLSVVFADSFERDSI